MGSESGAAPGERDISGRGGRPALALERTPTAEKPASTDLVVVLLNASAQTLLGMPRQSAVRPMVTDRAGPANVVKQPGRLCKLVESAVPRLPRPGYYKTERSPAIFHVGSPAVWAGRVEALRRALSNINAWPLDVRVCRARNCVRSTTAGESGRHPLPRGVPCSPRGRSRPFDIPSQNES